MSEAYEKMQKIAGEVLRLSHSTLLVNLRFLDMALAELTLTPSPMMRGIATDGTNLVYNPMDILRAYAKEKYLINRNYLHVLLHCLNLELILGVMLNNMQKKKE